MTGKSHQHQFINAVSSMAYGLPPEEAAHDALAMLLSAYAPIIKRAEAFKAKLADIAKRLNDPELNDLIEDGEHVHAEVASMNNAIGEKLPLLAKAIGTPV